VNFWEVVSRPQHTNFTEMLRSKEGSSGGLTSVILLLVTTISGKPPTVLRPHYER